MRVKKSMNTVNSFRHSRNFEKIKFLIDKRNVAASSLAKKEQQTREMPEK